MVSWTSWIALAGLGALHGLSPANGWMFAAACGLRAGDAAQARGALLPIALGHGAAVAFAVAAVAVGVLLDRSQVQRAAGALLLAAALVQGLRWRPAGAGPGASAAASARGSANVIASAGAGDAAAPTGFGTGAGHAGIALWSFLMASAHGAGLMLVPALLPLCLSDTPAREITASGSVLLALAGIAVHLAAMLLTTALVAAAVCRGLARFSLQRGATVLRPLWTASLTSTGAWLLLTH